MARTLGRVLAVFFVCRGTPMVPIKKGWTTEMTHPHKLSEKPVGLIPPLKQRR